MKVIRTDCLVIGYGLAGAAYAYLAARRGLGVTLLTADSPAQGAANSEWAQGGIIFAEQDHEDLRADILKASDGTANPEAVDTLVHFGGETVRQILLDDLKVPFDMEANGGLKFTREGGHSAKRIIYAKDTTGRHILEAVHRGVEGEPRVRRIEDAMAIDLLTLSHNSVHHLDKYKPLTCIGAYYYDIAGRDTAAIIAKKTILATGGCGQIFLHTTNQPGAVGHGIAMAYRVGARVIDMEFIQFHPTAFARKHVQPFLISEAVRGEGGVLVNADGEAFMEKKHPLASLAPRDIVARAIHEEMASRGDPCVYLDLSRLTPDFIRERFPSIYRRCLDNGVDITREPLPVSPAAHYLCGGIHTDMRGRTNIAHLNAIGETACTGLHGANRLASTSLLECLVGARLCVEEDAREIAAHEFYLPDVRPWESPDTKASKTLIRQDLGLIKNTMWNYVGLVRSPQRLQRARRILSELKAEVNAFYAGCQLNRSLLELRNALQTAQLVTQAASLNRTSRGCHYVTSDTEETPPPVTEKV